MKIQLASDLHLEFLQRDFPGERLIAPAYGADILVLAGDIANGIQAVELFKDWPVPVLYIAGNHEFYGASFEQTRMDLRRAAEGTSVRFLDNDVADFGGVRFLGATLWTDYRLRSNRTQRQLMENAEMRIRDHHVIRTQEGRFTAAKALEEHEISRDWLRRHLSTAYTGKTVVISHHGPHALSVHPRYAGDHTNAAFVSELPELLGMADLWLHGHVHDNFDYIVDGCRVVANPRGYALNRYQVAKASELRFENPAFQYACVIDVSSLGTTESDDNAVYQSAMSDSGCRNERELLSSGQAAKLLHVSRPYLNKLLANGTIPGVERTERGHRRIPKNAILAYKAQMKERQAIARADVVRASRELGLYEGELDGIPEAPTESEVKAIDPNPMPRSGWICAKCAALYRGPSLTNTHTFHAGICAFCNRHTSVTASDDFGDAIEH